MVKLHIKTNSTSSKYEIFDEKDNLIYNGESENYFKSKIRILDSSNNNKLLYFIKQTSIFPVNRGFEIYQNDQLISKCTLKIQFLKGKLLIKMNNNEEITKGNDSNNNSFYIKIEFSETNYKIFNKDNLQIGTITRNPRNSIFSFSDSYLLDINDSFDSTFFTAITIVIDKCKDKKRGYTIKNKNIN